MTATPISYRLREDVRDGATGLRPRGETACEMMHVACSEATQVTAVVPKPLHRAPCWTGAARPAHIALTESEVIKLIADGLTSKRIGGALSIRTKTVETHRTTLMRKLGVHSVAGVVRYAIRSGLVEP